jgi:hypothetical protein
MDKWQKSLTEIAFLVRAQDRERTEKSGDNRVNEKS